MTQSLNSYLLKIRNHLDARAECKRIMAIREYWQDYAKRRGISQSNNGNL